MDARDPDILRVKRAAKRATTTDSTQERAA